MPVDRIVNLLTRETETELHQISALELIDRIKASRKDCMEASRAILKVLKTDKSKRIIIAMELLEMASKNGDMNLHRYLSTTEYAKVFLKLLERKRGKAIFKHMGDSKDTKRRWDSIE